MPTRAPRTAPMPSGTATGLRPRAREGQAMVEFAAVLLPIMLVVVGIIQFGLLFNAEVTLTNAAREGGRSGTIYVYTGTSQVTNDLNRCTAVLRAARAAFGLLATTSPHFTAADPCTASHQVDANTWVNGDLRITYNQPAGTVTNDARRGYHITVRVAYRSDIIVPLIAPILPTDANGRFVHAAEVTMVVN